MSEESAVWVCKQCGHTFQFTPPYFYRCPKCNSLKIGPLKESDTANEREVSNKGEVVFDCAFQRELPHREDKIERLYFIFIAPLIS